MIWFLERNSDLLICEIRHGANGRTYEFEIAAASGPPQTLRFTSPKALIEEYLRKQSQLQAQGWRPRIAEIAALE